MIQEASGICVEGRSYPRTIQFLATALMLGLLAGAWSARHALAHAALPTELMWLGALAALMVVAWYPIILFSKTSVSSVALSQGWLWRDSVLLQDIVEVKWLRLRGLDAFFAPRLVVRTRAQGTVTFHVCDPTVLELVELLVHGSADDSNLQGSKTCTPMG